jgi:DUF4097 and DUF4098 domain-containing protein YvlB
MTKIILALAGMTVSVCSPIFSQEGNRVVVPARNSTKPRVVYASLTQGTIIVKTHSGKDVIVETGRSKEDARERERTYEGLKRIDLPPRGFSVEEEDNEIHIHTGPMSASTITITVPADTSLHLKSTQGNLDVDGVHGEIEAASTQGEIKLMNVAGSVVASTSNGSIKVVMDRVDPGKNLSFSSHNGDVDVTLPADLKANVKLRSLHGEIYSDFEVQLGAPVSTTSPGGSQGRFRVELDRTITGKINGGGTTEASFYTLNGKILIKKKK